MSKLMKANIVHTCVWAAITIGISVVFGMRQTAQNWGGEPAKIIVTAVLFAVGFIVDLVLRIYEKRRIV